MICSKMDIEPCKVCGSTEANLVDGFYYCVECGTQDVNVRETVVEEMELADGTISYKHKKKIRQVVEEDNLSGEWHKWHAYNFILVGLADEIIKIGARPSFKKKLLWLWTEYVKKFQNKRELGLNTEEENEEPSMLDGSDNDEVDGFYDEELFKVRKKPKHYRKVLKMNTDRHLSVVKRGLFFSLIYIALNLDGDNFHLSDLMRFIREGRFSINDCEKFVPKEINIKAIPQWAKFTRSQVFSKDMEIYIMSVYKCLNLVPLPPDLKVLVHRFAKELCLPDDFKNLVFSLMHHIPCDYLKINFDVMKRLGRIPPYECIIMTYFLVAFKMIFGLDDDYDVRLSDAVDKINDENCHLKSYKLGNFSGPTDRLFSFREWCNFIQLRKIIVCKNYLHMAEHYQLPIDHYVYIEQGPAKKSLRKPTLSDEITMTLLGRIPQTNTVEVIPISEFKASMTPLSSASDTIMQYFNDPDLKLLFSEDFTHYTLKYATERLYLNDNEDIPRNVIVGISETNKIINKNIIGCLDTRKLDLELVFVRNCENKNWLKTNQPSVDHVKVHKSDSDHGYDSNAENASTVEISSIDATSTFDNAGNASKVEIDSKDGTIISDFTEASNREELSDVMRQYSIRDDASTVDISSKDNTTTGDITEALTQDDEPEIKRVLETIEEEDDDKNIFDDDFEDLMDEDKIKIELDAESFHADDTHHFDDEHQHSPTSNENNAQEHSIYDNQELATPTAQQDDAQSNASLDESERFFNPHTFDREKTIRELILGTCKKYKIKIPDEYSTKEPKKRRTTTGGQGNAKRQKLDDGTPRRRITNPQKVKDEVDNLLVSYYDRLKHDVLFQLSETVKNVVNNVHRTQEETNNGSISHLNTSHLDNSVRESNAIDTFNDHSDLNTDDNELQDDQPAESREQIEIDSSNIDGSVQCLENAEQESVIDPRFNDKEYDPKQLYVEARENEIEDVFNVGDDPNIAAILNKKLEEVEKGELPPAEPRKKVTYDSDEDEVPLSVLKAEKESISRKNNQIDTLPHLVTRPVTEYNYWTRQYDTLKMRKQRESFDKFSCELSENYPKSFTFVIKECADVIGYTPYRLYKALLDLERRLLCYHNLNR